MSTLHVVKDTESPISAEAIVDYIAYYCGIRRLPWMPAAVQTWIDQGFDLAVIKEAVRRTARAPRPSWAYLEAIMEYASAAGCHDISDFLRRRHYVQKEDLPW